jgi:hypothetical protein
MINNNIQSIEINIYTVYIFLLVLIKPLLVESKGVQDFNVDKV